MEARQKLDWVDISRGIGILLVVLSHAVTKNLAASSDFWWWVRELVYLVHMPLFFLIGGFLFEMNIGKYILGGVHDTFKTRQKFIFCRI